MTKEFSKQNYIQIRVSEEYKRKLKQNADEKSLTVSDYVRFLINKDIYKNNDCNENN